MCRPVVGRNREQSRGKSILYQSRASLLRLKDSQTAYSKCSYLHKYTRNARVFVADEPVSQRLRFGSAADLHKIIRPASRKGSVSGRAAAPMKLALPRVSNITPKLANWNLVVPARAESEDGADIGDGFAEIGPDHPDFQNCLTYMKRLEGLGMTEETSGRRARRASKVRTEVCRARGALFIPRCGRAQTGREGITAKRPLFRHSTQRFPVSGLQLQNPLCEKIVGGSLPNEKTNESVSRFQCFTGPYCYQPVFAPENLSIMCRNEKPKPNPRIRKCQILQWNKLWKREKCIFY